MTNMRPGTIAAIVLAVAVLIYTGYSLVITPRMDKGAPGARPPIQDQSATEPSKPPLQDSNVPPAAQPKR
jgi:hypothetical protein